MSLLTIRRKAYRRSDGTKVKASTYKTKDKGKKGRTPKKNRWFNPSVHTGWSKEKSPVIRRKLALGTHKGDYLSTGRAMMALANVTTDKATARAARQDALYFYAKHRGGK